MTLIEAIGHAKRGDVQAMQALGEYYLGEKNFASAWDWFSQAADLGYTRSIVNATYVGFQVSVADIRALADFEKAQSDLKKTLEYSDKAIQMDDVPSNMKESIATQIPYNLFLLGYCLYMQDEVDDAISYLSRSEAQTPDCRVVMGLCYFEKAVSTQSVSYWSSALSLLKEVDRASLDSNEDLKFMAYNNLSLIYRMAEDLGIPGLRKDINLSYTYCLKASQCGDGWGEKAQAELKKYKKKLMGGYSYSES